MSELFPAELLTAIERLSLDFRPASVGARSGVHLSRGVGPSLDFRDYRPYTPGDDLRRVDWNVYQRSGHFFLRRFELPTAMPVHILVDDSPSMFVESPSRYTTAARAGLAIAAAALRSGDPVSLWRSDADDAPRIRKVVGRRRLPDVMASLSQNSTGAAASSLTNAVDQLVAARSAPGIAFVLSDFFDEHGVEALIGTLDRIPHRLVLVQITQPLDTSPELATDVEFVDCESGRTTTVTPTAAAIAAYRTAYDTYQSTFTAFAARRGATHVSLNAATRDAVAEMARLFPNGMLRVGGVPR